MNFHFTCSTLLDNFLFKGWSSQSAAAFSGACLVIISLTLLVEMLKVIRSRWKYPESRSETGGLVTAPPLRLNRTQTHLLQSFLHLIEVVMGYLLMLAVMSYNAWLFICVALASGVGYFCMGLFRQHEEQHSHLQDSENSLITHIVNEDTEENITGHSVDSPESTKRGECQIIVTTADCHT